LEKNRVATINVSRSPDADGVSFEALVVKKICDPIPVCLSAATRAVFATRDIEVADCADVPEAARTSIDLLIGSDMLGQLLTGKMELMNGMFAVQLVIGWTVAGVDSIKSNDRIMINVLCSAPEDTVDAIIDACAFADDDAELWQSELLRRIDARIRFVADRYWVRLPMIKLPPANTNFKAALFRLRKLVQSLNSSGEFKTYDAELMTLVQEGYAEPVKLATSGRMYYMPHRAVIRQDALTTKMRVVFDASSHTGSSDSLNECVTKGLDLNPRIASLLMKFRMGKVAVISDLRKAFLQIRIEDADRDLLRFLWMDDAGKLLSFRMTSLPFGATCSPVLLNLVIRKHLSNNQKEFPEAFKIIDKFYVDDAVFACSSVEEAKSIRNECIDLFKRCSMQMHKWRSSDPSLDDQWTNEDAKNEVKVLGLKWWPKDDVISACAPLIEEQIQTRRLLAQQIGSIFDPLGLFGPVTVQWKMAARELSVHKLEWDAELPVDAQNKLQILKNQLHELSEVRVTRCVAFDASLAAFFVFCDASARAIGAVVYVVDFGRRNSISLLMSKSRLAASRTMPQLELAAAALGVEVMLIARKVTGITNCRYYSDATTVLQWIKGHPNRLKLPFVVNRVMKIRSLSSPGEWFHIGTDVNPADCLSRGMRAKKLAMNQLWWSGPTELQNLSIDDFREVEPKICCFTLTFGDARDGTWNDLWIEAKRVLEEETTVCVEPRDILNFIWSSVQSQCFAEEIQCLKAGKRVPVASVLYKYVPFLDEDGLIRIRSRIRTSDADFDAPVVLSGRSNEVRAWLKQLHNHNGHFGVPAMLAHVREHHWIFYLRSACRRTVACCVDCRRRLNQPIRQPEGMLPVARTTTALAFTRVGIDFMGPLIVRPRKKRWVMLITCMVTRAVHLEVVTGLSTEQVYDAFERFMHTRGCPKMVHSDNGTSFVCAAKEIKRLQESLKNASVSPSAIPTIKWIFSTPAAPWQGGYFERLVGMVKAHLPLLAARVLSDSELRSQIKHAEALLNSRPIGVQANGALLTPGHLAIGKSPSVWPDNVDLPNDEVLQSDDESVSVLADRIRMRNNMMSDFFRCWRRSYLGCLRNRFLGKLRTTTISVGDVMLIHNRDASRSDWQHGTVVEVFPGPDGVVRNVKLDVQGRMYVRAVQLLSKLEQSDVNLDLFEEEEPPELERTVEALEPEREEIDADMPVLHQH
jgi:hypothetical protein